MPSRTVIFANGLLPEPELLQAHLHPDDLIICADGGAEHALSLGLTPHLVIGDLDSVSTSTLAQLRGRGCEIEQHPVDKDATDLELALRRAQDWGSKEVLLLGGWGGRLDQSLANLFLLASPAFSDMALSMIDGRQRAWIVRERIVIEGKEGDSLSTLALSPRVTGLTYHRGLRWPLRDFTLQFGSSRGISNEMIASHAEISLQSGVLLVIHSTHST
ncbi:MAG: thiamine diphosphokinase [Chloroflexi bacterium]|nr:thiamine diphosphokinase [Chloroflexota bacterium]